MQLEPKQVSAGLPSELLANRPDIRRAELELQAAALDIKVAHASFYPFFALKAGVGLEAFDQRYLLETPASLLYGLSADMIAPLINRRAIAAELHNASAAQVEAAYEYELTVLTAFSEVSTQLSQLDKLTQREALEARSELIETKQRQLSAMVNLYRALGGGWQGGQY